MGYLISLCIPTNGVQEWIFPVLDSIFAQNVENSLFEVVVVDNGNNEQFFREMTEYCKGHDNMLYEKTDAPLFLSEIEVYKRAKGEFIKFINHRTLLKQGTLMEYISFIRNYQSSRPIVYFANGSLKLEKEICKYGSFDEYVRNLSIRSSWSTGMGFWREDFEKVLKDAVFNELFPHTNILFGERKRETYIIDHRQLLDEMPEGGIPKGKYDVFYAFAVEYPAILCDLLRSGDISTDTFLSLKKAALEFVMEQYYAYVLRKRKCSYDLSTFEQSIRVFYSEREANACLHKLILKYAKKKLCGKIGGKK